MRKLPGVESVQVSLTRALTEVTFKADNTVTLGQLRRIIKNSGFNPGETHVTVHGRLFYTDGQPSIEILPGKWSAVAKPDSGSARVFPDATNADAGESARVEVYGRMDGDVLIVKTLQPVPRQSR
jgi:hypothetical protein